MASMVGTIAPTPLTSEWLAAHGCDVEDGEDVDGEEPMEAGENGSISRVALRRRGGETRTLVAKRPPTSPAALSVAATQQWYARELFFYEALAGRLDATTIRAPRRAASALSAATGDFCLVLEDLAASGCRPFREGDAAAGAAALRRLHGSFLGASTLDRGPLPVMPVHVELADFIEAFFVKCWASVKAGGVYDLGAEAAALVGASPRQASTRPSRGASRSRRSRCSTATSGPRTSWSTRAARSSSTTGSSPRWATAATTSRAVALGAGRGGGGRRRAPRRVRGRARGGVGAPAPPPDALARDANRGVLLGLASFVIGAAGGRRQRPSRRSGARAADAAALDWGAVPRPGSIARQLLAVPWT
ncbi:hypothetical protein JL722_11945 [Aureococcus anophagefferens]|nr:hypothetical protein JL722_11945 [Aureococcus anophagefferens]